MPPYEWRGSGPLRRGSTSEDWINPGDRFDPTEDERASFGDLLNEVDDSEDTGPTAIIDPGELTVSELRDHLSESADEYTDGELAEIAAAERTGKNRSTALDVITGYSE